MIPFTFWVNVYFIVTHLFSVNFVYSVVPIALFW